MENWRKRDQVPASTNMNSTSYYTYKHMKAQAAICKDIKGLEQEVEWFRVEILDTFDGQEYVVLDEATEDIYITIFDKIKEATGLDIQGLNDLYNNYRDTPEYEQNARVPGKSAERSLVKAGAPPGIVNKFREHAKLPPISEYGDQNTSAEDNEQPNPGLKSQLLPSNNLEHYARDLSDLGGLILDGDTGDVAGDWQDVALFEEWKSMDPRNFDNVKLSEFMSGYWYMREGMEKSKATADRKKKRELKNPDMPPKKRGRPRKQPLAIVEGLGKQDKPME